MGLRPILVPSHSSQVLPVLITHATQKPAAVARPQATAGTAEGEAEGSDSGSEGEDGEEEGEQQTGSAASSGVGAKGEGTGQKEVSGTTSGGIEKRARKDKDPAAKRKKKVKHVSEQ